MDREIWKSVVGYEGIYEVSNTGKIRSLGRVIMHKDGNHSTRVGIPIAQVIRRRYLSVRLNNNAIPRQYPTHRLVMAAFIGKCPEGLQVNHIDGVKTNNSLSNLEYVTAKENIRHSFKTRLNVIPSGENSVHSYLSNLQAKEIREKYKTGKYLYRELAEEYKICHSAIGNIVRGKTYPDLEDK